jgi:hypothetical protein
VHYVVAGDGARIYGRTIRQRVALIDISAPEFRAELGKRLN